MRILFLFSLITLLYSCASVEMAREVTRATKSIKTSVTKMVNTQNNNQKKNFIEPANDNKVIEKELANLKKEKKKKEEIIKEQKKEVKINFLGKTPDEIKLIIGQPELIRIDGNSEIVRFDSIYCQLFLFSNKKKNNSKIEYFEIRNKKGELIINKENINKCYKQFKLI